MGMLNDHGPRPVVDCSVMPSKTVKSEKQSCDINFIVSQYRRTGNLAHLAKGVPSFLDVSEVGDFRELVDAVRKAEEWFARLPSEVRAAFGNDAADLMDALADPSRRHEIEAVGLKPEVEADELPKPEVEPVPA